MVCGEIICFRVDIVAFSNLMWTSVLGIILSVDLYFFSEIWQR